MKLAGYIFAVFYFTVSRGVCSDIPSKLALSTEYGCGESETSVYVDDACLSILPIPRYNSSLGSLIQYRCQSRIGLQLTANIDYCPVQICHKNRTWSTPSISCAVSECVDPDKVYSGRRNCTKSGLPCQLWSRQKPHKHKFIHNSSFPDKSVADAASYCRDPDKFRGAPWCFTQDPNIQWEYCDIPDCKELPLNNGPCSEKVELNSKVDCGMPDFQIKADNDCVSLGPLTPFGLTEGSIVINRCASLQHGVFPVSKYCPVEVCQQNGTWRSAYVSCAETECYNEGQSKLYKGNRICTSRGIYCIEWQTIDLITFDPDAFPDDSISIAASYCRDPEGQKGAPWCYVDKKGSWDYCSIPECSDIPVIETPCTKKSEVIISVVESSMNDRNGKIPFFPVYKSTKPTTKASITKPGLEPNEINYTDVYSWKATYEVPIIQKVNNNTHAQENNSLPDNYHTTVPFTNVSDGGNSKQKNTSIHKHYHYTTTPVRNVTDGDNSTMTNSLLPEQNHNITTPVRNFADGENSTINKGLSPEHYHNTTTPVQNVIDGDNNTITNSLLSEHNRNITTPVRNFADGENYTLNNSWSPEHYHNTTTPVRNVTDGDNSTMTNSLLPEHIHNITTPVRNFADGENSTLNKGLSPEHYHNTTTPVQNVIDGDNSTITNSLLSEHNRNITTPVRNFADGENYTLNNSWSPEHYHNATTPVRNVTDGDNSTMTQSLLPEHIHNITTPVRNFADGENSTLNKGLSPEHYHNTTTPVQNVIDGDNSTITNSLLSEHNRNITTPVRNFADGENYTLNNSWSPEHYHNTTTPVRNVTDGDNSTITNSLLPEHNRNITTPVRNFADGENSTLNISWSPDHYHNTTTLVRNVTDGDNSTITNGLLPEHYRYITTPVRNFADGSENSTLNNSLSPEHYHNATTPVRNVQDGDNSTMTNILLPESNRNITTPVRNLSDGENSTLNKSLSPEHYHNTPTHVQNFTDGDNSTMTNSLLPEHNRNITTPVRNFADGANSTLNNSLSPEHYHNTTRLVRNVTDNDYHTQNISSFPYNYHDNKMSAGGVSEHNNSIQNSRFLTEIYNYTAVNVRHVSDNESHTQKNFSPDMHPKITSAVRNQFDGGNHSLDKTSFIDNRYNNNTTPVRNISHDIPLEKHAINTESTFLNNANNNMKAYQRDTTDRVVSSREIAYNAQTADTFSHKSSTSTLNNEVTPGWPNILTTFEKIVPTKNTVLRDILTSPLKIKTAFPSDLLSTTEDDRKFTYNKNDVTKENFPVTKHYNIHTTESTDTSDNFITKRIQPTVTLQDTKLSGFVSLHQILTHSVQNRYKTNSDSMDFVTMGTLNMDYIKHGLNSIPEENYDMVDTDASVGTESIRNEHAQSTHVNYFNIDTNEPSDHEFFKDLGFMTSQGNYKTSVPVTTSNDGSVLTVHEDYNTVDFGVITDTKYNKHTVVSTPESRNYNLMTHVPYILPLVNPVTSTEMSDEITLRKETSNYKGVDKDAITRLPFISSRTDDTTYLYRTSTMNPNGPITVSGDQKATRSTSDVKTPSLATNYDSVIYKKPTNVDSENVTISVIRETFSQTERRSILTNFQFLNNNNMATIAENVYTALGILTYKFIKNSQRFTQQNISRIQIMKTENELQSAVNACKTKHNANQNYVDSLFVPKKFKTDSNLRDYTSQSLISSHSYSQIHLQQFDQPFPFRHINEADIQFNSAMSLITTFNVIECARNCEGNESCILFRFRSGTCALYNMNTTADGGICSQSAFSCYVKSC